VVGFNGLYDLAGFISSPPTDYAWLKEGYREFVTGAFGADEKVWRVVCPAWDSKEEDGGTEGELFVKGWVDEWIGSSGRGKVMLVNSWEDSLVPWQQAEVMRKCWGLQEGVAISVVEGEGDHDDAWKDGKKMAEVLWHVASSSL
jgi:kynurenine formamidase